MLLWALVAAVVLTGLAYAVVSYVPALSWAVGEPTKIIAGGIYTVIYLAVAIVCAACGENGRAPRLMRSGLIIGAGGLVAIIVAMVPESDALAKVAIWPVMWASLMAVIGLLLLPRPRPGWWKGARRGSIVLVAALAAAVCLTVSFHPSDITTRLCWSLALVAAGAVTMTLLGVWIPGFARPPSASGEPRPYWLRCPRCGSEQEATTGEYRCRSCGLNIRVEVA